MFSNKVNQQRWIDEMKFFHSSNDIVQPSNEDYSIYDPSSHSRKRWILSADNISAVANALSIPPGEYARKSETQRNWRGPAQAVDYVD